MGSNQMDKAASVYIPLHNIPTNANVKGTC